MPDQSPAIMRMRGKIEMQDVQQPDDDKFDDSIDGYLRLQSAQLLSLGKESEGF